MECNSCIPTGRMRNGTKVDSERQSPNWHTNQPPHSMSYPQDSGINVRELDTIEGNNSEPWNETFLLHQSCSV